MTHKVDCICAVCEARRARPRERQWRWVKELAIYATGHSRQHGAPAPDTPAPARAEQFKVGRAWLRDDGTIVGRLDAVPVNGEFEIRERKPSG